MQSGPGHCIGAWQQVTSTVRDEKGNLFKGYSYKNYEKRILSAVLTVLMTCTMFTVFGTGAAAAGGLPLSITEPLPEGDLFQNGEFDKASVLRANWAANGQTINQIKDANGTYLEMTDIRFPDTGFDYWPSYFVYAGTYKFTGYFRTANPGEIALLQTQFWYNDGTMANHYTQIYIDNNWLKVEIYIKLEKELTYIKFRGGAFNECIQSFCVDNFSMVPIAEEDYPAAPATVFGDNLGLSRQEYSELSFTKMEIYDDFKKYDPEYEKQFEVNGIILNHDCTNFLKWVGQYDMDAKDIIAYAKQFEGTHITDYMINVSEQGTTVYPSSVFEDYSERYLTTEIAGVPTDFTNDSYMKAAYDLLVNKGTDYVGLLCETFPTIGINPWLSFRMNDIHDQKVSLEANKPNALIAEFYYTRPDLYRVKHRTRSYTDMGLNFEYEEVREMMLAHINDALNSYDVYGIELDYQREIRLFSIGGEYNGLDILNEFMREVDALVAVYEEKYGHEIKTGVRVASDIQTNYDFGLDVITWAHEGLVDLVIPTGRFESLDFDTPTRTWSALLKPLGIELAPCHEQQLKTAEKGATYQTYNFTSRTGFAANAFSQGADKIALFNYFLAPNALTAESEKWTYNSDLFSILSGRGAWNYLTTVGSYDKLMTVDRRCFPGYQDTAAEWNGHHSQLPLEVKENTFTQIRIPVGDIPEGAKVTFKISYNSKMLPEVLPTVYVNSELCTYIGTEKCRDVFTTDTLLCYEVPVSAHDDTYVTAEIFCKDYGFTAEHAEVYIKVAD